MHQPAQIEQRVAPVVARRPAIDRALLERRARRLAWGANAWHVAEFAIALAAGISAGSIALIGFGIDSLIEVLAGGVILWLFTGRRRGSAVAERRAQLAIAATFFLLAGYVAVESVRTLIDGDHPDVSWVGIALAAVTAPTMPLLARAKRRVGHQLGSAATVSEGAQNMVCAYLSIALLLGLGANAVLGWWWADPVAALGMVYFIVREGREAWEGKDDCCG